MNNSFLLKLILTFVFSATLGFSQEPVKQVQEPVAPLQQDNTINPFNTPSNQFFCSKAQTSNFRKIVLVNSQPVESTVEVNLFNKEGDLIQTANAPTLDPLESKTIDLTTIFSPIALDEADSISVNLSSEALGFIFSSNGKIQPLGSFPGGWCTSGVASIKGGIPWSGNAKDWFNNAKKAGYSTGSSPSTGAIIIFGGHSSNGYFGHVGVIVASGKLVDMNGGGSYCGGVSSEGKCKNTYGKFAEASVSSYKAPILGYIYYNTSKKCPPSGSSWYGTHTYCQ